MTQVFILLCCSRENADVNQSRIQSHHSAVSETAEVGIWDLLEIFFLGVAQPCAKVLNHTLPLPLFPCITPFASFTFMYSLLHFSFSLAPLAPPK